MMRRGAGFHADETRRQLLKERQNVPALESTANDYITRRVNSVDLKNRLSDIETDRRDRLHAWLLRIVGASTAPTSMALPCRWRSRPQHQYGTARHCDGFPTGHAGSKFGGAYTLGASLNFFSYSAIIDFCSSGDALLILSAAALCASSPLLIFSMTCVLALFPISSNELPTISASHGPPKSLHFNLFISFPSSLGVYPEAAHDP